jgi:hypothetical protein
LIYFFLTSGEQIFGYQYKKEEKSDILPLKGLCPLLTGLIKEQNIDIIK